MYADVSTPSIIPTMSVGEVPSIDDSLASGSAENVLAPLPLLPPVSRSSSRGSGPRSVSGKPQRITRLRLSALGSSTGGLSLGSSLLTEEKSSPEPSLEDSLPMKGTHRSALGSNEGSLAQGGSSQLSSAGSTASPVRKQKSMMSSMFGGLRKRLAAARDEIIESDNMRDRLVGAVSQFLRKPAPDPEDDIVTSIAQGPIGWRSRLTEQERTQKWYDVWWAASRPPRRRNFAATRIQNTWAM